MNPLSKPVDQLLTELSTYQTELEAQNEELRRALNERDALRLHFFDFYDFAPVGYATLDATGLISQANQTAASLLGIARSALVGRPMHVCIHHDDRDIFYLMRRKLTTTGASDYCELRMVRGDASVCWMRLAAILTTGDDGRAELRVVITDITQQKLTEEALRISLQEKDALLKEVHHRVKNNLQVITSLLRLESGRTDNLATQSVLGEMKGRIRSMALMHESLYRSGTFAAVDLGNYLKQLATQAFRAQMSDMAPVHLKLHLASVQVGMDLATPCGLLVNELISNCFKHGFVDGRGGEVRIELQPLPGATLWRLQVSDNGVGIPADFEVRRHNALGLQLVSDLSHQLGGTCAFGPGPGALFTLDFPVNAPASPEVTP